MDSRLDWLTRTICLNGASLSLALQVRFSMILSLIHPLFLFQDSIFIFQLVFQGFMLILMSNFGHLYVQNSVTRWLLRILQLLAFYFIELLVSHDMSQHDYSSLLLFSGILSLINPLFLFQRLYLYILRSNSRVLIGFHVDLDEQFCDLDVGIL